MISLDTNLLLYANNQDAPDFNLARNFLQSLADRKDVVISEFVLIEFYICLRNPAILNSPLSATQAVNLIEHFRRNSNWRVVGFNENSLAIHNQLWVLAKNNHFGRRQIIDYRLALSLIGHGVKDFATVNTKDFKGIGFKRVWNPLD